METTTLVFGAGWIGGQMAQHVPGARLVPTDIADEHAVRQILDTHRPTRVVNCAGKTGRPNVDALECMPGPTYRSNVAGPITLAAACLERDIHLTHLGSGCIYSGDNGGTGWREDDASNFDGSLYSRTKLLAEATLRDLGVLQFRLRLPFASTPHPRNLLTKLLAFQEVVSTPNSVTILDDFWAPALALIERRETGVWNMVNPGAERHDEVLAAWQTQVDATHRFGVIETTTLASRLKASRSNCLLNTDKLTDAGLGMPAFATSLPRVIDGYAAALGNVNA